MITFETQEDFDKAVMQALHKYLGIDVWLYEDCGDVKVIINLRDDSSRTKIASCNDYCTVVQRD